MLKGTMAEMKWTEIRDCVEKGAIVLLPLGVMEEHGPHLPLGTDAYMAHAQCLATAERLRSMGLEAVVAPPFYWGVCLSTGGFIGSFTSRKETVKAVVYDIVSSLASFGFRDVFGINAHGDVGQNSAMAEAFKEAREGLGINARYAFPSDRLQHYGLTGEEPYLCPVEPPNTNHSRSAWPDVHAGDQETAAMNALHPHLVDASVAKGLPPVALDDARTGDWLFGGHMGELSPQGYLGAPADFGGVCTGEYMDETARRLSRAIGKSLGARP